MFMVWGDWAEKLEFSRVLFCWLSQFLANLVISFHSKFSEHQEN